MEGRNSSRSVNIPYIPSDKLGVLRSILSDDVTAKVSPLFKQLLTFWNEKRMVRNGVPLIRRLLSVQKTEKDNHATEDDKKKIKVSTLSLFESHPFLGTTTSLATPAS